MLLIASVIWKADFQDRIKRGHRFLKDHGDCGTAQCPHVIVQEAEEILALKKNLPGTDFCPVFCSRRMIEKAVTLLPQPDSPTRATVSRLLMWKERLVDGMEFPVVSCREGYGQAPDVQKSFSTVRE